MSGHIRRDRIGNECIKEKVEIAPILEKMIESRFRWMVAQQLEVEGAKNN